MSTHLKATTDREISWVIDSLENHDINDMEGISDFIEKGIVMAKENNNLEYLAHFYMRKGNLLRNSNPDLALKYFYKTLKLAEKIEHKQGIAASYVNIATNANLNLEKKLYYFNKGLSIYRQTNDTIGMIQIYNNMATAYSLMCIDSALPYHEKVRILSEKIQYHTGLAMYYINMAATYVHATEDYETALKYSYKAKSFISEESGYAIDIDRTLMKVYFKMGHIDSALYYYDLVQPKFNNRSDVSADTYQFISDHYLDSKDFHKALLFDKKADSVKEYVRARNNENQLKFLEMEYDSKLHEQKLMKLNAEMQRSNTIRIALAAVLFLTIAFFLILIRLQRQKAKKKQHIIEQNKKHLEEKKKRLEAEQKLLSAELESSEFKRKYLYDELKYTNRELSSFATGIIQNHMLWDDVRTRIKEISQEKEQNNAKQMLKELDIMLLQVFDRSEQRYEFIQRSRQLNHSVVFYLKNNYECLTEKDINLLILILLKFKPKEMAVLCNVELGSIRKSRHRIRKKMGLSSEETLEMFFERIMTEIKMRDTG